MLLKGERQSRQVLPIDFDLGPADAKKRRADIMSNPNNPLHEAWKSKRHPRKQEAMDEIASCVAYCASHAATLKDPE